MLSPFLVSSPKPHYLLPFPLLTNPPTPISWPWQSSTLGHSVFTGPRDCPPLEDQLRHPLLHMHLEPLVPPRVLFGWWFSPKELWGYWLVHIVVPPMELKIPSAPGVVSLYPSLGTLCSFQWMAVSIHFCICQTMPEPLRRQLYQAPVSKHLLVILFPLLWRIKVSTPWSSFFLSFLWIVNCILGILSFWEFISCVFFWHWLPHSGWYSLNSSICLRIS